jgi:hypothetical protein
MCIVRTVHRDVVWPSQPYTESRVRPSRFAATGAGNSDYPQHRIKAQCILMLAKVTPMDTLRHKRRRRHEISEKIYNVLEPP